MRWGSTIPRSRTSHGRRLLVIPLRMMAMVVVVPVLHLHSHSAVLLVVVILLLLLLLLLLHIDVHGRLLENQMDLVFHAETFREIGLRNDVGQFGNPARVNQIVHGVHAIHHCAFQRGIC